MQRILAVATALAVSLPPLQAQTPATQTGPAYVVAYVDALPTSRADAIGELMKYREASQREPGFVRMELFEQVRRGAHFNVIEVWADAASLNAHATAASKTALIDAMKRVGMGGYDERPYKNLSVAAPAGAPPTNAGIVITHVDTAPAPGADAPGVLRRLAEASRREPGNLRFDVLQHSMRANHFTIIETWTNPAAADTHLGAASTRQYRQEIQPLMGSPLDERMVRSLD